jgi:preprotein translocase subunit SecG
MFAFIITVHVIASIFLIFVILLQPGKGDAMAAFAGGGGGANTVFGGRGSVTFLSKVTTVCAIIFMLTSLTLAWRSSHSASVLQARRNIAAQEKAEKKENANPLAPPGTAPATAPETPAPAPAKK